MRVAHRRHHHLLGLERLRAGDRARRAILRHRRRLVPFVWAAHRRHHHLLGRRRLRAGDRQRRARRVIVRRHRPASARGPLRAAWWRSGSAAVAIRLRRRGDPAPPPWRSRRPGSRRLQAVQRTIVAPSVWAASASRRRLWRIPSTLLVRHGAAPRGGDPLGGEPVGDRLQGGGAGAHVPHDVARLGGVLDRAAVPGAPRLGSSHRLTGAGAAQAPLVLSDRRQQGGGQLAAVGGQVEARGHHHDRPTAAPGTLHQLGPRQQAPGDPIQAGHHQRGAGAAAVEGLQRRAQSRPRSAASDPGGGWSEGGGRRGAASRCAPGAGSGRLGADSRRSPPAAARAAAASAVRRRLRRIPSTLLVATGRPAGWRSPYDTAPGGPLHGCLPSATPHTPRCLGCL